MSDIIFDCPFCDKSLKVEESGAGMEVPCPECGSDVLIPQPVESEAGRVQNVSADTEKKPPPEDMRTLIENAAASIVPMLEQASAHIRQLACTEDLSG